MLHEIEIYTPFIKLDQLLKFSGLAPDGVTAKEWILEGLVRVDGEICLMRGKKIYPGMQIAIAAEDEDICIAVTDANA